MRYVFIYRKVVVFGIVVICVVRSGELWGNVGIWWWWFTSGLDRGMAVVLLCGWFGMASQN